MADGEAQRLVDQLAAITANLTQYLTDQAAEMAAPAVAESQEQVAATRSRAAAEAQRSADLIAELRRQLEVALTTRTRLMWVARYLPAGLRYLVISPVSSAQREVPEKPSAAFMAEVEDAGARAGLVPYPEHGRD